MLTLQLQIQNMTCEHCLKAVHEALASLDSVTIQSVTIGRAEVTYDPARVTTAAIADAVNRAGYTATPE